MMTETSLQTTPKEPCGALRVSGFTLFELVVVLALIGIIAAIAFPQFLPVLAFSQLEGGARHLAAYGRSAMAHVNLMREPITIHIDLDEHQYWATRVTTQYNSLFEEEEGEDGEPVDPDELDLMHTRSDDEVDAAAREATRIRQRFDMFARSRLEACAKNVKRDGILDDIGPLFEEDFSLEEVTEEEEEVDDPLLVRTTLPEEVIIEKVSLGDDDHYSGEVEIELSPMGLAAPVLLLVTNEDKDDYYTIVWDPVTISAYMLEGEYTLDDVLGREMEL